MNINIKFFSTLRDIVGSPELLLKTDAVTAGELWVQLEKKFPKLSPFSASRAVAVNHEYVRADHKLHEGDEIAFFPPVSGG
ncbi:molybdopterin converting factor subunit 1 [Candidatus Acetothermia bacterium]|nr:molybdopterin converting factor subunit 1 [Candidatus Acetothermia bacterium]MBI3459916.1 molybdopterin converting factor subunit 1 [Candidatus Acetothermia bacterium]MBI3660231.1 molybdopterin converting factor subunit 1 [Candidatus Acetothermia bacterium]